MINIESSHCYGSMTRFLSEVSRVLRPNGYLLLADLRGTDGVEVLHGASWTISDGGAGGTRRRLDRGGTTSRSGLVHVEPSVT